jgi:hypothetical protein
MQKKRDYNNMFTQVELKPSGRVRIFKDLSIGEVREVSNKSLASLKSMVRFRMRSHPGETYSINEQGPPFQLRRES